MTDSNLRITAPLVTIYVGAVAAIYQHTFWKPFHVNILQYISLMDMIKLTLWPLIGFSASYLVGYVINKTGLVATPDLHLPKKYAHFGPVRTVINQSGTLIILLLPVLVAVVKMFAEDSPYRWVTLSMVLGILTHILLTTKGLLAEHLPNFSMRYIVLGLLTIIPWYAWGDAKTEAELIERGFDYDLVTASNEFRSAAGIPDGAELRHLGNTGSYTLLLMAAANGSSSRGMKTSGHFSFLG
jgi:hypothetical protein